MPLDAQATSKVKSIIDNACADQTRDIPGTTIVVVDRNGEIFAHSAGTRGVGTKEPMTLDNIFWIASCTKMLAGIACMQLVEQEKLKLDDGEHTENILPELKSLKVLKPDGTFEDKKNLITLRMLLTHTAGFGYTFFNERLRDWTHPAGVDEFSGRIEDIISLPLLFQPGEGWEYGTGIDWAGIAVERVSGLSLNDYLQKHVFQPLGITNMSMLPDKEMRSKLAYMHQRDQDGKLRIRDHLQRLPLVIDPDNKAEAASVFNSGGAGMFAQPQQYGKILTMLLNGGACPKTGNRVLRQETIDLMFSNSVEKFPNFSRQVIPAAKPDLTNRIEELYKVSGDPPQGWGLTFMLTNGGPTGRSTSTVQWAGLANLWWWADREHGVAGIRQQYACDQCRKSKRGCDAPPLEYPEDMDPIRDGKLIVGEKPPLVQSSPCSYCIKTHKSCTMNWAWTQLQVSYALAAAAEGESSIECIIPSRRKPSQTSRSPTTSVGADDTSVGAESTAASYVSQSLPSAFDSSDMNNEAHNSGMPSFLNNPLDSLPFDFGDVGNNPLDANFYEIGITDLNIPSESLSESFDIFKETADTAVPDNYNIFPLTDLPEINISEPERSFFAPYDPNSTTDYNDRYTRTKRRRVSQTGSDTQHSSHSSLSSFSLDQSMMARSNQSIISSNLLHIYHDVLEHNLTCWLNEITCPFGRSKDLNRHSPSSEWGSSWSNRVLRRTLSVDRGAQSAQLIHISRDRQAAVSKAYHLAIMAFATQWAQESRRQKERYPSLGDGDENPLNEYMDDVNEEFGRHLQRNLWDQARRALDEVADVESFRVVSAEMIFGLTQKPLSHDDKVNDWTTSVPLGGSFDADALSEEISDIIENNGPPIYMERAARKMHVLKYRYDAERRGIVKTRKNKRPVTLSMMSTEDQSTISLLYWLSVMFDTVSSSMAERPVVVVDANSQHDDATGDKDWNVPLFIQDSLEKPKLVVHWPCSYDEAAEAVARSAPVKILMFRHVHYLQTVLRQGESPEKVEEIIERSVRVYRYWNMTHGTFFRELLENYDSIPSRIQSWFICISAPMHLGVLLLADLVSQVDANSLGLPAQTQSRTNSKWIMRVRERSAKELSDLARVTTPSTPLPSEFHHALNESMILTEPWTVILERAFSKAAIHWMGEANDLRMFEAKGEVRERLAQAEECIRALWILGKKSDSARRCAEVLAGAKRKIVV
ncbi:unnamed protein product [Fusarium graminearum]|nr:unnamed protein product [Fusarium graminearum]VTO90779.1 unnamed protein product [Fusarium graminearum]